MNSKKIFVLTTPKSGTFLWEKILPNLGYDSCGFQSSYYLVLPQTDDYEDFYLNPGSHYITQTIEESISKIKQGEFGYGHLPCLPSIEKLFSEGEFQVFFQSRDLRESVCSMMRYESKFDSNKDAIWGNSLEDPQARLVYYLDQRGAAFRDQVAQMMGWVENISSSCISHIKWRELNDGEIDNRVLALLGSSKKKFNNALAHATNSKSITKSSGHTAYETYWSDRAELIFQQLGLGDLNQRLGYVGALKAEKIASKNVSGRLDSGRNNIQKKVLVVVNKNTAKNQFILNLFNTISKLPKCHVEFVTAKMIGNSTESYDFSAYSAVILTPHIRPWLENWGNPGLEAELLRYNGLKILFLHDEYDQTNYLKSWINNFNVQQVFSVVPKEYLSKIYPQEEFPSTEFHSILTYYPPKNINLKYTTLDSRVIDIFYRGRPANPCHGELAVQKYQIGSLVKEYSIEHQLITDISSKTEDRLRADRFIERLSKSKATLATESGSNIFDLDGSIQRWFKENASKENIKDKIPESLNYKEENIGVKMNQVSPKMFEAISLGTALIMYEGEYSGILEAGRHYIPLKLDHSNIDDVLEKISDTSNLQKMVDRAYNDIIVSGSFSESVLIDLLSKVINNSSQKAYVGYQARKGLSFPELHSKIQNDYLDKLETKSDSYMRRIHSLEGRIHSLEGRINTLQENKDKLNSRRIALLEKNKEILDQNKKLKLELEGFNKKSFKRLYRWLYRSTKN